MVGRESRGYSREHYVGIARNRKNPNKIRTHNSHPRKEKWHSREDFWCAPASSAPVGGHLWTSRNSQDSPGPSQPPGLVSGAWWRCSNAGAPTRAGEGPADQTAHLTGLPCTTSAPPSPAPPKTPQFRLKSCLALGSRRPWQEPSVPFSSANEYIHFVSKCF